MSRARHHAKKAMGGGVKPDWNAGGTQNAAKEAEEKKHGGKVHGEGHHDHAHHGRHKRRAAGGAVPGRAHGGKMHHHKHEHEHERADGGSVVARARGGSVRGRARGGGIGANLTPLSTAARVKHITKGETPEMGEPSD
jgi:hypothetical protein